MRGPKAGSRRHRLPRPGEHLRGVLAGPATAGTGPDRRRTIVLAADRGAPATHITTFRSLLVSQDSHAVFGREGCEVLLRRSPYVASVSYLSIACCRDICGQPNSSRSTAADLGDTGSSG